VASFLTERVAGLAPAAPAFSAVDVRPLIRGGLQRASATRQTPYGVAASSWTRHGNEIVLDVTIPPGASGHIHAGPHSTVVGAGIHTFAWTVSGDDAPASPGEELF
jgi:alpha-L-rhamnosidase